MLHHNPFYIYPSAFVSSIEEKEKNIEKYELSFLGVLLVLAMISRKEDKMYTYYDKTASNYREKQPLIFGKWRFLEKILGDRLYECLDYLLLNKAAKDLGILSATDLYSKK
jgi:hypothetical protein